MYHRKAAGTLKLGELVGTTKCHEEINANHFRVLWGFFVLHYRQWSLTVLNDDFFFLRGKLWELECVELLLDDWILCFIFALHTKLWNRLPAFNISKYSN